MAVTAARLDAGADAAIAVVGVAVVALFPVLNLAVAAAA